MQTFEHKSLIAMRNEREKLKLSATELTNAVARGLDSSYVSHEGGTWIFDSRDPKRRCRIVLGRQLASLIDKGEVSAEMLADHIAGYAIAYHLSFNAEDPPMHKIDIAELDEVQD
jgi:hypothetical protein